MAESHIENAVIKSTFLGKEDRGIFTCILQLEGPGWSQGFGGFNLNNSICLGILPGILAAVGAESWEQLKGKLVRVRRGSANGKIEAVGHIIEDRWFDLQEFLESCR